MTGLFQIDRFRLASGAVSRWKVECDALGENDWTALAAMALERLPAFGQVIGVPRGGLPFARALRPHATPTCGRTLIADDVWTTGGSLLQHAKAMRFGEDWIGIVAFARNPISDPRVRAVWTFMR